jgi:hypothetical protein
LLKEFLRPWKLVTFSIGMCWLLYGATHYAIPDWDVGVSIVMGVLSYTTAPRVVRVLISWQYKRYPAALLFYWFSVDGCYWLYHALMGNQMFREANFYASSTLYFLCGFIWLHNGPLRTLVSKMDVAS